MRLAILAGEASGDVLGAALLDHVQPAAAMGVTGPEMLRRGCVPIADVEELQLMGLLEVSGELPRLFRLMARIEGAVRAFRPDVLLTIDSPSFMLRIARRLRGTLRTVHWVSPQIWAWRGYRAARIARSVDAMACLLPFEPGLYSGLDARFTGHPAAAALRSPRPHFLGVAAGSRPGERGALGPIFREVALASGMPLVEATPPGRVPVVPEARQVSGVREMAQQVSAAMVCSGTATLELAAARVPMVAAYAPHWLTRRIAGRLLQVDSTVLPNLVLGRRVVPELHPPTTATLRRALDGVLCRDDQTEHFDELRALLQPDCAIENVARMLLRGG